MAKLDMLAKLYKTGFFHIMGTNVLTKPLMFINSIVLVRILTKQEYGIFAYVWNIYSLTMLMNGWGMDSAVLQVCCERIKDNRFCQSGGTAAVPEKFCYLTCHREENTNRDEDLREIFKAMEQLDFPVIYPVHPRNHARALQLQAEMQLNNVLPVQPVGYLESACMVKNAQLVVTDSGGLQREAFFAGKKCVTLLDFVVWPETMVGNHNVLAKPKAEEILEKIAIPQEISKDYSPFGDGHAAEKIVNALEKINEKGIDK